MEDFKVGDKVRILNGKYAGIIANVVEIYKEKLIVTIEEARTYVSKRNVIKCLLYFEKGQNPLCNLTTCNIVLMADANGCTYASCGVRYSKEKGFHDSRGNEWPTKYFESLDFFVHLDGWEEIKLKKLTKSQIEKKLGYEIEIVDESEDK